MTCISELMPSIEHLKHLQIPFLEISLATNGFSKENFIGVGGYGPVYQGMSEKHGHIAMKRLLQGESPRQGDNEFKTEIALLSKIKHENIVSLIGFCDEDGESILVYKFERKMSLDRHLKNEDLTWTQRVRICLDAARGLNYLHHGIIHRDIKSSNLLLDENFNAKICDFGLSIVVPANPQSSFLISDPCGTPGYIDLDYMHNGYLTKKTDVYSFGVVLCEVLCGRLAIIQSYNDERRSLNVLFRHHYSKGTLDKIIPSYLEINRSSLHIFSNIAYECLKNEEQRPTMQQVVEQLEKALQSQQTPITSLSIEEVKHLQIPFQEISLATNGFAEKNLIGRGGFGNVYKGISEKHGHIAIKRLDHGQRQGDQEFNIEIDLLSVYKHKNIVSLLGFCDEYGEKILVYKYESRGSLDRHLDNQDLTWIQRIQICLDAACGLKYLHDDVGPQHQIIHRDVKSANVLLDEKWDAKISDFGLSRVATADMQATFLISNPCGTPGYIDPDYCNTGYLTQKSDVYSFGIVLFEVLCGRPTIVPSYKDDRRFLTILVRKHHKRQTLDRVIPSYLHKQMNTDSLLTFSSIAYQCLKNGEERPTIKQVVEQLQKALDQQLASCSSHQDLST